MGGRAESVHRDGDRIVRRIGTLGRSPPSPDGLEDREMGGKRGGVPGPDYLTPAQALEKFEKTAPVSHMS